MEQKENLKVRYDLTPQYGIEEVNKVLTSKLIEYKENQWCWNILLSYGCS